MSSDGQKVELPDLWLGLGCQRQTAQRVFEEVLQQIHHTDAIIPSRIAGFATLDRKRTEPGLLAFIDCHPWPIVYFTVTELQGVMVPHPSLRVQAQLGLPSVAEAAALRAACQAGDFATLLVPKQVYRGIGQEGSVTWAIAQSRRSPTHLIEG